MAKESFDQILLSADEIAVRVRELARSISDDYAELAAGNELICVGILKGAVIFLADLTRAITVPVTFDFMAVSSYGAATRHSGVVRILKDLDLSIAGRHVLIIEDIIDSGLTLRYLYDHLLSRKPRSLRVCVLLDKIDRREVEAPVHYRGFTIPDAFAVGYGLDWDEQYRNLPHVAVLSQAALDRRLAAVDGADGSQ